MQLVRLAPIGVLALTVAACGTLRPASVGGGECRVFERPEYAVLGQTRYDQNWIDSNTEAGVAACGWRRPKPRPQGVSKATDGKQLAPAKKKQPGFIGRIKRAVVPSASDRASENSEPGAIERPARPPLSGWWPWSSRRASVTIVLSEIAHHSR